MILSHLVGRGTNTYQICVRSELPQENEHRFERSLIARIAKTKSPKEPNSFWRNSLSTNRRHRMQAGRINVRCYWDLRLVVWLWFSHGPRRAYRPRPQ